MPRQKMRALQRPITCWEKEPVILDPFRVSLLLGIPVTVVRKKARDGEIPAIKLGRQWRFEKSALMAWAGVKG